MNDGRAGVHVRRSEGPRVLGFAMGSLPALGRPSPSGRALAAGAVPAHLCTIWKQAELSGPSETCVLPAGEQFVA